MTQALRKIGSTPSSRASGRPVVPPGSRGGSPAGLHYARPVPYQHHSVFQPANDNVPKPANDNTPRPANDNRRAPPKRGSLRDNLERVRRSQLRALSKIASVRRLSPLLRVAPHLAGRLFPVVGAVGLAYELGRALTVSTPSRAFVAPPGYRIVCGFGGGAALTGVAQCNLVSLGLQGQRFVLPAPPTSPVGSYTFWDNVGPGIPGSGQTVARPIGGVQAVPGAPYAVPRAAPAAAIQPAVIPAALPARVGAFALPVARPPELARILNPYLETLPQGRQVGDSKTVAGKLAPGVAVTVYANGRTALRSPSSRHLARRLPPKHTREGKSALDRVRRAFALAIGLYSEGRDYIGSFYAALPEKDRKDRDSPLYCGASDTNCQAVALWKYWDRVDHNQAVANLIENYREDLALGKGFAAADGFLRRAGINPSVFDEALGGGYGPGFSQGDAVREHQRLQSERNALRRAAARQRARSIARSNARIASRRRRQGE